MTFTSRCFLKSLGWREGENTYVFFVSSTLWHLQGRVSRRRQESKEYEALKNADECMLRAISSMFSVPPHRLIWGIHKLMLESLFQNLLISSRVLLVISNWSCLKNSERLGHRKRCNCEMVCLSVKATCRNKDMLQILWFWQRMGDTDCLVGVEYSHFLN